MSVDDLCEICLRDFRRGSGTIEGEVALAKIIDQNPLKARAGRLEDMVVTNNGSGRHCRIMDALPLWRKVTPLSYQALALG